MKNGHFPLALKLIACPFQSSSFKLLKIYSNFAEQDMLEKKCKTARNIRSIHWRKFCIIWGNRIEQYMSLSYSVEGTWILWCGSHFDVCFVVEVHRNVWSWLRKKKKKLSKNVRQWRMAVSETSSPIFETCIQWKGSLDSAAQWKRIYQCLILCEILYFKNFCLHSRFFVCFLHTKPKHTSPLVIYDDLWNIFFLIGSH